MLLPFFDKFRKKNKNFCLFFLNEKLSTGFYLYSNQYLHLKINSCLFGLLFLYFSTFSSFQVFKRHVFIHTKWLNLHIQIERREYCLQNTFIDVCWGAASPTKRINF